MKRITKFVIDAGTALSLGLAATVVNAYPWGNGPGLGMGPGQGYGPGYAPGFHGGPGGCFR